MLQSEVRKQLGSGVVGDLYDDSIKRADPYNIKSIFTEGREAVGTVSFAAVATADDTVSVAGTTFTFAAAADAATNKVAVGSTASDSAANLADAINAADLIVTARATSGIVTLKAIMKGTAGNHIELAASVATVVAFADGLDDVSADAKVGNAFCYNPSVPGEANAGCSNGGVFAGILINSKEYANNNNLSPSLIVPDGTVGQLLSFGRVYVKSETAVTVGYTACFNNNTGDIRAIQSAGNLPSGYTLIPNSKFIIHNNSSSDKVAVLQIGG